MTADSGGTADVGSAADVGAAADVGSNSLHLLVAEIAGTQLRVLRDDSAPIGLGAQVDLAGHVPADGVAAAIEILAGFVEAAAADGAAWTLLLATEPLRRASNRTRVCQAVEAAVGVPLHVLSHEEEALLTVLGVLRGTPVGEATLVIDIGGGSSEVVLIEPDADPVVGILPVGSARLTAAHVEDDPPTTDEVAALRAEAHHLLSGMPAGRPVRGIVVGGSGTNLLQLTAGTGDEKEEAPRTIDRDRAQRAIEIVASAPAEDVARRSGLRQGRILQMAAGASLIEATLDCYALDRLEASDASLREGAILARARAGEQWRASLADLIAGIDIVSRRSHPRGSTTPAV
jgi:exopolyphosphatase/guanosine-5'-triphosphate,3'-diphosphate pyrophosphatase